MIDLKRRLGRAALNVVVLAAFMLLSAGCSRGLEELVVEPEAGPNTWYEPDYQPQAFDASVNFAVDGDVGKALKATITVSNKGDLPVAFRYPSSYDALPCQRMSVSDDLVEVLLEPHRGVFVGGAAGMVHSEMLVVQPQDQASLFWSVTTGSACDSVEDQAKAERPSQWRLCVALVELPAEYLLGGAKGTPTDNTMELDWLAKPVYVCSEPSPLPAAWYGG